MEIKFVFPNTPRKSAPYLLYVPLGSFINWLEKWCFFRFNSNSSSSFLEKNFLLNVQTQSWNEEFNLTDHHFDSSYSCYSLLDRFLLCLAQISTLQKHKNNKIERKSIMMFFDDHDDFWQFLTIKINAYQSQ